MAHHVMVRMDYGADLPVREYCAQRNCSLAGEGAMARSRRKSLALAGVIGLCAPLIALSSAGAQTAPAASTAPTAYTSTVRTGASLLGGTTDIGNHCGSWNGEDTSPCTTRVVFPFPVKFYGVTYTSALADTAGNIQFTGDATRVDTYGCIPDAERGAMFAVYSGWAMQTSEDRTPRPPLGIFTAVHGTAPHRTFVVEWRVALTGLSYDDPYAEWDFEARFLEGSSTVKAVFGDSWSNESSDGGDTWVKSVPAGWYGATGVQDGLGNSTGGCGSTPAKGVAVSFTTTATPPTTVEQNSSAVKYSGTWAGGRCGSSTCSPDHKQMNSSAAGSQAKFSYTGKSADWIASRGPHGGKVAVYVDGVYQKTVNLYSTTIVDGLTVYTGPAKTSGPHTLTLKRVSGRINVDAFRVH